MYITTHYAHPDIPQLAFYERIAAWVGPGGTLLIVGHLHPDQHDEVEEANAECPGRDRDDGAAQSGEVDGEARQDALETSRSPL